MAKESKLEELHGMTPGQIKQKLSKKFKSPDEQIQYLNKIIKRGALTIKTWNSLYQNLAELYEQTRDYDKAGDFYAKAKMKDEAKKAYIKAIEISNKGRYFFPELYSEERIQKEYSTGRKLKALDSIVTSILAFGGIGLLFSFFSKPAVISAQNVQLAPPFPNYMIYIFAAMLIGGIGYFLVKRLKE